MILFHALELLSSLEEPGSHGTAEVFWIFKAVPHDGFLRCSGFFNLHPTKYLYNHLPEEPHGVWLSSNPALVAASPAKYAASPQHSLGHKKWACKMQT